MAAGWKDVLGSRRSLGPSQAPLLFVLAEPLPLVSLQDKTAALPWRSPGGGGMEWRGGGSLVEWRLEQLPPLPVRDLTHYPTGNEELP